jgi:3',5'-cyclic AMP phosphodiesterase CpdA
MRALLSRFLFLTLITSAAASFTQQTPALNISVSSPFKFVAYGDMRFADPGDHNAGDEGRRVALIDKIADERPAFVVISGDFVVSGDEKNWRFWDKDTQIWREQKIPVLPTFGNHDVRGGSEALDNYFHRFPDLRGSRWYSARAGNVLVISLDSTGDGVRGRQMDWVKQQLASIPGDVDFVMFNFHHPPYTKSHDMPNGGHSARPQEQELASLLEARQQNTRARFIVFSGHVHNYERYERAGVHYIVSGGGGAKPYMIPRTPDDHYRDDGPTYHYCLLDVSKGKLSFSMYKLEMDGSKAKFTKRDSFELSAPASAAAATSR